MNTIPDTDLERAKYDALAEFAAGAGHEINNPLAIISGRAQLLLATELDESRRMELSRIIAQARRAHEMLADLWLVGHPPELHPTWTDLRDLLDRFAMEFTTSLQRESAHDPAVCTISLRWRRPTVLSRPPVLEIDGDALMVALHAVGRNAVEAILRGHTESSRSVDLRLTEEPRSLRISVTDYGDGIPPDVREHLFDPFYSGRQAGRGLGFGLCKARRIVELSGGTIRIDSTSGENSGTTVRMEWYRNAEEPAVPSSATGGVGEEDSSQSRGDSRTFSVPDGSEEEL
ncbi:MAG: HAMP domain-containing sensor histidine kinase [Planctomycetia bacterium]|nr:HAMP domain-containing sensor histidine kinase [Planctomycetia bacterium]